MVHFSDVLNGTCLGRIAETKSHWKSNWGTYVRYRDNFGIEFDLLLYALWLDQKTEIKSSCGAALEV